MRILAIAFFCLAATTAYSQDEDNAFGEAVMEAMDSEIRSQAERDRDRNRRPVETLAFFGLREDMRVLELMPGGGWYTKLLAPALARHGKLYVALGTGRVVENLLNQPGFDEVEVLAADVSMERREGSRFRDLAPFSLTLTDLDAVLTFRNLHNLTTEGRASLNRAVFAALAPGGIYGVIDHNRRHMQPTNSENRRRLDPVLVIKEMLAVGFELVDYSDLHHRLDDELRYEVGRKTVTGNTDRFTLLFRKPE